MKRKKKNLLIDETAKVSCKMPRLALGGVAGDGRAPSLSPCGVTGQPCPTPVPFSQSYVISLFLAASLV